MTILYIKMKIRAGVGSFRAGGGTLGQQGAPSCYSSLWETLRKANHYAELTTELEFRSNMEPSDILG